MHNESESKQLLELMSRLQSEQDMIGWLCTVHKNKVHYQGKPEASDRIQHQLETAATLISLAYIWAILEEHNFYENNQWVSGQVQLELKAWKHVRHTGAHAPSSRATRYFKEFNQLMEQENESISGLRENCTYTSDSINLNQGMNYRFFQFTQKQVKLALGCCANDRMPTSS